MDSTGLSELALPELTLLELTTRAWPIAIEALPAEPAFAFDRARGQYNSTRILERLPRGQIVVTGLDLFIPILEYVFGEAELGGRRGIVSTYRLRQEFYGLPPDPGLLLERTVKEARHEWGHALGLRHCYRYDCVMRASPSVDQVDLKSAEFCESCREELSRLEARK